MDLKDKLIETFSVLETHLNGEKNSAIHKARKESINAFAISGFPDGKNEEWKYTETKSLIKIDFKNVGSSTSLKKENLQSHFIPGLHGHHFVFINGIFNPEFSAYNVNDQEYKISQIANVAAAFSSKEYRNYNADGFIFINEALGVHDFTFEVLENVILNDPVIFSFFTDASIENAFSLPRVLLKAEVNSELKIVEQHIKLGNHVGFTDAIIELTLEEGSNLTYYKLLNDPDQNYHVGTTQVNQKGKSTFNAITISLAGKMIRNNLNVTFGKPFSEAHLYGLSLLRLDDHVDNHTAVDHAVPNCESNEIYKNILDDNASGVFNGKIFVRKDAQKTNAYQSSKNILLSDHASAYSKPQLEIWADDVKCSHGHSTGQLNKEALFYLKSRGIGEDQAKPLLVKAFAEDILNKITIEALKSYLEKLIEKRFENVESF